MVQQLAAGAAAAGPGVLGRPELLTPGLHPENSACCAGRSDGSLAIQPSITYTVKDAARQR